MPVRPSTSCARSSRSPWHSRSSPRPWRTSPSGRPQMRGNAGVRPLPRLPAGLAPLGVRNFGLYWTGFLATNTGKWIEQTGAVWVAYELSRDPLLLGLLGIVRGVPTIIVTPLAGVLVDRVDQRRL